MESSSGTDKSPKIPTPHRQTMPVIKLINNSFSSPKTSKGSNTPKVPEYKNTPTPRKLSIAGKNNRLTIRRVDSIYERHTSSKTTFSYFSNQVKNIKSNFKTQLDNQQKEGDKTTKATLKKSFYFPPPNLDQMQTFINVNNQNKSTVEKVQMLENIEMENLEKNVQKKLLDMSINIQNPKKKNTKFYSKDINSSIFKKRKLNKSCKDVSIFSNLNKIDEMSEVKHKSSKNVLEIFDKKNNKFFKTCSSYKNESHIGSLVSNNNNNNTSVRNSTKFSNSLSLKNEIINKIKILKEEKKYRIIEKKKLLYDSFEEDESDEEDLPDGMYISPDSNFIFLLDLIILICSLFCVGYLPIQLAQSKCFCIYIHPFILYFQYLIDGLFIFDFVVNFYRGYYKNDNLIKNNKLIFIHYLKNNFSINLIDSFPLYSLCSYFCKNYKPDGEYCIEGRIDGKYTILKVLSLLKITRIFKVVYSSENKAMKKFNELISISYAAEKVTNELIFIFLCLSCLHLFVCFYIFIGLKTHQNWILLAKQTNSSFSSIYITSFYFIITTMTTVGYGDIVSSGMKEISFQLILLTIGIIAYSYIITIMGNHFKNESRAKIKFNKNILLLEEIRVSYPNMSFKLYSHIKHHLNSIVTEKKKCNLSILVNTLPYSLQNEILLQVYCDIKNNLKFLKMYKENNDLVSKVLKCFIPLSFQKNAFVMKEGELIENIIFIQEGKLALEAAIDLVDPIASVMKYIHGKFKDFSEKEGDFRKKLILNYSKTSSNLNNSINKENTIKKELTNAINPKDHQSFGVSYMHETFIEEEIDKYVLQDDDIEDGNYCFINILNLYKNEDYGIYSMLINKPNPLSLKVKSKKVDIFLLRKKDALKIFKAYPELYETASQIAFNNMIGVKNKTIKEVRKYCNLHGIDCETPVDIENQRKQKYDIVNFVPFDELVKLENAKIEARKLERKITAKSKKFQNTIKRGKTMENMINKFTANRKSEVSNKDIHIKKILSRAKTNIKKRNVNKKNNFNDDNDENNNNDHNKNNDNKNKSGKNNNNSNNKISTQITLKNSTLINHKIDSFDNKSKNYNSRGTFHRESMNSLLTFNDKNVKSPQKDNKQATCIGNNEKEVVIKSKFIKETKIDINISEKIDSKKNILSNENLNSFSNNIIKVSNKTIPLEDNENESPGTLNNIFSDEYIKKIEKKIKFKGKPEIFYRNLCLKLISSFKKVIALHNSNNNFDNNNITFSGDNSIINNITNPIFNTIIQIPQIEKLLKIKENSANSNSSENSGLENQKNQKLIFASNKCQISKRDSFQYDGLYSNLNKISNKISIKIYNEMDLKHKNVEKKIKNCCKDIVKKIIVQKISDKKPKFKETAKSSLNLSNASSFNRCSLSSDSYISPYYSSENNSENVNSKKLGKEFEDFINANLSNSNKKKQLKDKKRKRKNNQSTITNISRTKKRKNNNKKKSKRENNLIIEDELE